MKVLAVITARKHSKRLINKNFRRLLGMSLTEHTVFQAAAARDQGAVTDLVLSTDSDYLLAQNQKYGLVDLGLRPAELSGDRVKSVDVLLYIVHRLEQLGRHYDAVMTLQPTSPLRNAQDIVQAVELFRARNAESLITAAAIPNATINGLYEKTEDGFLPVSEGHNSGQRHQTLNPIYLRNGAIFITRTDWLKEHHTVISTRPVVLEMPRERSVDVDDAEDLCRAAEQLTAASSAATAAPQVNITDQIPDISTGLEYQKSNSALVIWEDIFRLWLYSEARGKDIPEFLSWAERHAYFDGLAVLVDGECVNAALPEQLTCPRDDRLEAYLAEKLQSLSHRTPSLRLKLAETEG